jgi:DNA-directed RNA polymerase subunit L
VPLAAYSIELFFGGHGFPDRQSSTRPVALLAAHRPDHRRYALEKGQGAWALTYDGAPAAFIDRAGVDFVSYYLKHPREPIHSLDLLARVQGEAPVQQRSAALDDAEVTKHHLREMSRRRAAIASDDTSDQEKEVAEEELAQLEAALPDIHHRTNDEAFKTTKSVRQAIRRVCLSLAEAVDEQHRPHPVLTAFAAHLQKHLLGPSQPGLVPAGHLVYEPPEDVIWA